MPTVAAACCCGRRPDPTPQSTRPTHTPLDLDPNRRRSSLVDLRRVRPQISPMGCGDRDIVTAAMERQPWRRRHGWQLPLHPLQVRPRPSPCFPDCSELMLCCLWFFSPRMRAAGGRGGVHASRRRVLRRPGAIHRQHSRRQHYPWRILVLGTHISLNLDGIIAAIFFPICAASCLELNYRSVPAPGRGGGGTLRALHGG